MASSVLHSDTADDLSHNSTTSRLIALEDQYGAHNYHPLDVVIERAEGVWVYDVDGKRYLDCLGRLFGGQSGPLPPADPRSACMEQASRSR